MKNVFKKISILFACFGLVGLSCVPLLCNDIETQETSALDDEFSWSDLENYNNRVLYDSKLFYFSGGVGQVYAEDDWEFETPVSSYLRVDCLFYNIYYGNFLVFDYTFGNSFDWYHEENTFYYRICYELPDITGIDGFTLIDFDILSPFVFDFDDDDGVYYVSMSGDSINCIHVNSLGYNVLTCPYVSSLDLNYDDIIYGYLPLSVGDLQDVFDINFGLYCLYQLSSNNFETITDYIIFTGVGYLYWCDLIPNPEDYSYEITFHHGDLSQWVENSEQLYYQINQLQNTINGLQEELDSANTMPGILNIFSNVFNSIGGFLNIQIAPYITIGMLLMIPVVIAIIVAVIKIIGG